MEKISRLTPKFEFSSASTPTNSPALLTANTQLVSNSKANGGRGAASTPVVLFRLEHHSVDKMRTFYSDCELDAGGLPVILINRRSSRGKRRAARNQNSSRCHRYA